MKTIICISGSSSSISSNIQLINLISKINKEVEFKLVDISRLPLFQDNAADISENVSNWKIAILESDGLIICTPEYLHNIPAALKSALEWLTSSGELFEKRVLPITYTPAAPRGEKAMQSLLWSLDALDARIVTQLDLYQTDLPIVKGEISLNEDHRILIKEAIQLLLN